MFRSFWNEYLLPFPFMPQQTVHGTVMESAVLFPRLLASCSLSLKAQPLQEADRLVIVGDGCSLNMIEVHLLKAKTNDSRQRF
jgi:hypothetical protein